MCCMECVDDCSFLRSIEQSVIKPSRVSVSSGLALNSRLYVLLKGHSGKLVSRHAIIVISIGIVVIIIVIISVTVIFIMSLSLSS